MSAFSNIVACVKKLYLYICCFGDELVCLSHNKFLFCSVLITVIYPSINCDTRHQLVAVYDKQGVIFNDVKSSQVFNDE